MQQAGHHTQSDRHPPGDFIRPGFDIQPPAEPGTKESTELVSDDIAQIILEIAEEELPDCGALMLSDYGKGVLSAPVLSRLIALARAQNKPVNVAPKGDDHR